MQKFLGLSGKAGHGKDTVAAVLTNMYGEYGVVRRAFADALKEDIGKLLVEGGAWEKEWYAFHSRDYVEFVNSIKHHPEVRALLQWYGVTQRKAQPNYWIQRLKRWASVHPQYRTIVVPDCRFQNEAEALHMVYRVVRPGYASTLTAEQMQHPSETDLDKYKFSGYIYNDGDINRLRQQCQGNALEYFIRKGAGYVGVSGVA